VGWLGSAVDDQADLVTVTLEQRTDPVVVSNVEAFQPESIKFALERMADMCRGGLGTKEGRSHVVVDADDIEALLDKEPDGFRSDESA
jgi:hypothetical protein